MPSEPRYGWDSNCFLAWLGAPVRPEVDMDALRQVYTDVSFERAALLTSVLLYTEVLSERTSALDLDRLERLLQRGNVFVHDVNRRIAKRAEAIRSSCLRLDPVRRIKGIDAIFAATAVLRQADVLHTTDDGLLNLDGHAIVDGLRIALPGPLAGE